jgi:hypothetical protein
MSMKNTITCLTLILAGCQLCLSVQTSDPVVNPADARVTDAEKILAAYQAGATANHRVLHVAYFCPADRAPAPDYRERLTRVLDDISSYYATQIRAYGLPSQGIPLDKDADGELIIHMVKGSHPAVEYSEAKSAGEIHEDVKKVMEADGIGLATNHVVVFTRLGNYDGTNTSHNSPYCGTGDGSSGFCWQFDSDLLDTRLLTNTNQWLNDHQYGHISLGRYNTIFIGGTAHELGHCFGLPHNAETPADFPVRGHALMGDGNRHYREEMRGEGKGTFITLAHALRLVSNPLFSGVDKGLSEEWSGSVTDCVIAAPVAGQLNITGKFKSNQPVYGVVAYIDPDGGSNYDAASYVGTLGPDDSFAFNINSLPKSKKPGEIRIVLLCASGQSLNVGGEGQFHQRYTIDADGRLNVEKVERPKT